jgi:hypothetical protein
VHGGSHAAPLIGKVLKEIYGSKGSDKSGEKEKPESPEKPKENQPADESN